MQRKQCDVKCNVNGTAWAPTSVSGELLAKITSAARGRGPRRAGNGARDGIS